VLGRIAKLDPGLYPLLPAPANGRAAGPGHDLEWFDRLGAPIIDLETLRAETFTAVWDRGAAYAADGGVALVSVREGRLAARVTGTETYRCVIEGSGLRAMTFTCPAFEDYPGPCKHLIAVALTLALDGTDVTASGVRVRDWLMELEREALVSRILDLAEADPDLEACLLLKAETAPARPQELEDILRKAVAEATATQGFVDYRRMRECASGVDAVIDRMMAAAGAGRIEAEAVLGLVPDLIGRLEDAVGETEDDGHIGMLLGREVEVLAAAVRTAQPDAQAFDLGTDYAEIGPPEGDLAEAMGKEGLAAYWSAIEAELGKACTEPARRARSARAEPRRL